MEGLLKDLTLAFRSLRRRPGLTAAVLLCLALGLGASLTIFRLIDAAFLQPLGIGEPAAVVAVYVAREQHPDDYLPISFPNFQDLAREQRSFSALAAYQWLRLSLQQGDDPRRIYIQIVPRAFFDALGMPPARGRLWTASEDSTVVSAGAGAAAPVAVLSDSFWRREMGSDPDVLGKTVRLAGRALTVIGVMPPGFKGTRTFTNAELWVPLGLYPEISPYAADLGERGAQMFDVVGRLRPGVSLEQATLELKGLAAGLAKAYPEVNRDTGVRLLPLGESSIEPWQRPLFVRTAFLLAALVALLLVIACGNVASLLLARGLEQRHEVAVRLALGADRGALIRQLMAQSLLLGLAGGALGLLLGWGGPAFLWRFRPPDLFTADALDFGMHGRVFLAAVALSLGASLVFGLAPALQSTRPRLVQALKGEAALAGGRRRVALLDVLVGGQVALCFLCLAGAGLFLRSLERAQQVAPGFDSRRLLVMSYGLSRGTQPDTADGEALSRRLLDGLGGLPGVERVALASYQPLTAGPPVYWRVEPEGEPKVEGRGPRLVLTNTVSPGYFATLGMPLLAGRDFAATDRPGEALAVVVNDVLAKRLWPDRDPLGRQLRVVENGGILTVVGVVRGTKHHSLTEAPRAGLYLPLGQWPRPEVVVHLRTAGRPESLIEPAQRLVRTLAPTLTLYDVEPMQRKVDASLWAQRLGAAVLGLFAGLALVLAVTGVYAVLSYSVERRSRELGIRLALGARPAEVQRLVLRRAAWVVGSGILVGLATALVAGRFVASLLFDVQAHDPATLAAITVLLGAAALVASYRAARRATRVDPRQTLQAG